MAKVWPHNEEDRFRFVCIVHNVMHGMLEGAIGLGKIRRTWLTDIAK